MNHSSASERGQAVVLLVFGMVALLGFTALAIDGGMVYSERRHAQNAADAAAMAAALAKVNGQDWLFAARQRAFSNGYSNDAGNNVSVHNPPTSGQYAGNPEFIQVIITSDLDTSLIHFVYSGLVRNTVEAVARAKPAETGPMFDGHALVGLKPHGDAVVKSHGTPDTFIYGAGIFVNSDDPNKAFWQNGSGMVQLESPYVVNVVGEALVKPGGLSPADAVLTNVPQQPYPPLVQIPPPPCDYTVASLPLSLVDDSIYCVTGDITINGGDVLTGHNVLIYLPNGNNITFNGNATINLDGPDTGPYKGLLIYVDPRGYTSLGSCTVKINGTSASSFTGTIYAPTCNVELDGTGDTNGLHSQVIGYTIDLGGTTELTIRYLDDENFDATSPPMLELSK